MQTNQSMVISSVEDQWLSGAGAGRGLIEDSKEHKETSASGGDADYPDCSDGFMMYICVKTSNYVLQNFSLLHVIYTLIKLF